MPGFMSPSWRRRTGSLLSLVLMGGCVAATVRARRPSDGAATPPAGGPAATVASSGDTPRTTAQRLRPERLPACNAERSAHATPSHATVLGNPEARRGAQRGLEFVARSAIEWQTSHNCYGCHVQAVTLEALTVGKEHQYDISPRDLAEVLRGMTDISGGHRRPGGLSVGGSGMQASSRAFGGAAFARYDATVGPEVREDLPQVAEQLLEYQNENGSVRADDTRFPVVAGEIQATTQALQTWRQVYGRTADERWLAPIRRAEEWMQGEARRLSDSPDANLVSLNYAVMGLLAAGAQPGEQTMTALGARLRERQREDGSWSFTRAEEANAFATGQALYALRSLGASDGDATVDRGTRWLIAHQSSDGSWSHGGREKAEAMWAVFGLVSIDVLSLTVAGARDGEHVDGTLALRATATDNSGAAVEKVDLTVDDVPVARGCGANVDYRLDTSALATGVHFVDVIATNARGQTSRRRMEVYTGPYYLTHLGSRYENSGVNFSMRNVAPATVEGRVTVRVYRTREESGAPVRDREVWSTSTASAQGPVTIAWNGHNNDGAREPGGRYLAEAVYTDRSGRTLQTVALPFVNDTPEAERAQYGEVAGNLQVTGGPAAAEATVELVDRNGNVVQSTTSNEQGNYRFRAVSSGDYRVRVRRAGFRPAEAPVQAAAARPSSAGQMHLDLQ